MTDQRVEKWARWIDGPIKNNVLTMHLHRYAWREMGRIVEGRDLPASYWWEFLVDTYVATQTMAIRRQADTHKDVASLAKVIQELRDEERPVLTRDRWVELWSIAPDQDYEREHAARQWTETFGTGEDPTRLNPRIPAADFVALEEAASAMQAYADQHIAHSQANRASAQITLRLSDMHAVIDTIGELFRRYYSLLMAADYAILTPVIQHDWRAVFEVPWMEPRE